MDTVYLTVKWLQPRHNAHYLTVHTAVSISTTFPTSDIVTSSQFSDILELSIYRMIPPRLQIRSAVQLHSTVPSISNHHIPMNNSKFRDFTLQRTSNKWPNLVLLMNSAVPTSRLVTHASILRLMTASVKQFGHNTLNSGSDQAAT